MSLYEDIISERNKKQISYFDHKTIIIAIG